MLAKFFQTILQRVRFGNVSDLLIKLKTTRLRNILASKQFYFVTCPETSSKYTYYSFHSSSALVIRYCLYETNFQRSLQDIMLIS